MNTQKVVDLEQAFKTFVSYARAFGIDTDSNLTVIKAAFKTGFDNGRHSHVKDCNKNIIPPEQENKTVISNCFGLKGWKFRNEVIEHILKVQEKPLTPSEIAAWARHNYDIDWYEKSLCGYIQTAMAHGKRIVHVTNGAKRGKYVYADYADKYKDVPEFEPIKKKYPMEKGLV
jgi:hypothetical protein